MDADELDDLFGRIALEKEYITGAELKDAIEARRHLRELGITDRTLADIMVRKGYVSETEKEEIIRQLEAGAESGTTVHGYQVLLELEHERPGTLYKAYQRAMDRTVLLRVLSKANPEEAALIPTLKREAKLVAKLQHPAVVAGYDAGETDEEYFLVSEFVEGIKLSQLLELEGRLGEEETLKIALKMVRAIEYLDEQGIVHRDIEPENILVTKSGGAKIANFVLAITKDNVSSSTSENILTATPFYVSPEQAKGFSDLDVKSDLFSLGATLYHMLTGQYPFGNDAEMALAHIITREPPDPRTIVPEVSQLTSELVTKLLQKEKENRYQGATEVRKRVEEILTAGVSPAPAAAKPRKSGRSRRGRVKRASRMFAAHAGPAAPVKPAPLPFSPAPPAPAVSRPTPAPGMDAGVRPEPVRGRSAAVTAAKTSTGPNTAVIAIIGLVVAVIIIIAAVCGMPSPKPRAPSGPPEPPPRHIGGPEPSGPKVSDVAQEDIYPEDVKEFRKLLRLQNEFPGSPEVVEKYNEFLKKVKDPGVKEAAEDALKGALNTFYNFAHERAKKLRQAHRYAEALTLYQKLLSMTPETQKSAVKETETYIGQTKAEADMYFTDQSSRAEALFDRGQIEAAIAVYEELARNSLGEHSEIARKIVDQRKRQVVRPSPGPIEQPPGPDRRTPEEIEAQRKKKEAEARLRAMKERIIAELRTEVTDHVRGLRIVQARRVVTNALKDKKDPAILSAVRRLEKHMGMIEKAMGALDTIMAKLYKKNIIELWLKKRQVVLGELIKYESGILLFKKRNNETIQIRLSDIRDDEIERYLLEGFGEKSAGNLLSMAVFFVYFYGDGELTRKYIGRAKAAGADVKEYLDLLSGASFESALIAAEDDVRKKRFFSAHMKLCKLRDDFAQTEAFKQRKKYIEEITRKAYTASGLGRLFVGKLTCKPPLFEVFYDFSHSSQLNDFSPQVWDAKGADLETDVWRLEDDTLSGAGEGALIWSAQARGELSVTFFAEPRETGPFELLLFADPDRLYAGRAYAFGFSTIVDEDDKDAEPEHYIALWDGKKGRYKYLKRGIMNPDLEEKKTYLVQIIIRHHTLQLFIDEKLRGEVKDTSLDHGTVVLRVNGSITRFDNLTVKARLDDSWLRKAAKDAK